MRWLWLGTLLACNGEKDADTAGEDTAGEDTAEPVDTIATRLREGADLCAYEDGEIVEVPEAEPYEGYIADPYPELYQPCLDGLLYVGVRVLDHPEGRLEPHSASAQFFTVSDFAHSWLEGTWLDPLDGVDDCGLIELGRSGLESASDLIWLDPGDTTLLGSWGETAMTPYDGGLTLGFDVNLSDLGIEPAWGEAYGLSSTGSSGSSGSATDWEGTEATELPEIVVLPERLEVTAPTPLGPEVSLARADLDLEWTGSSDGELALEFTVTSDAAPDYFYELRCSLADDGAFALPGALLEALPEGSTGTLYLTRREDAWVGMASGRSFHAYAVSRYEAWNLTVP